MIVKLCATCAPPRVEQLSKHFGVGECQACESNTGGELHGFRLSDILAKLRASDTWPLFGGLDPPSVTITQDPEHPGRLNASFTAPLVGAVKAVPVWPPCRACGKPVGAGASAPGGLCGACAVLPSTPAAASAIRMTFCSFSGDESNLGIVVLDGLLTAAQAAARASELGINPGGELLVLPVVGCVGDVHFKNRNRLIPIQEAIPLFGLARVEEPEELSVSDEQWLDQGEPN